jgi:hypothetical protein
MADISLGTFEVLTLQQMGPTAHVPVQLPDRPDQPPPPPMTYNITMAESPGTASVMFTGLTDAAPSQFAVSDIHLGKQYEVILREVAAR